MASSWFAFFFICITLSDKNVDEIKFWDSLLSYFQSRFKDNIYFYHPFIYLWITGFPDELQKSQMQAVSLISYHIIKKLPHIFLSLPY